jgi:hypothetical protein
MDLESEDWEAWDLTGVIALGFIVAQWCIIKGIKGMLTAGLDKDCVGLSAGMCECVLGWAKANMINESLWVIEFFFEMQLQ